MAIAIVSLNCSSDDSEEPMPDTKVTYEMSINKFHHCIPTDMIKFFMRIPECAEIFSFFIFSKL